MENEFAYWEILLVRKQKDKISPVDIARMLGKDTRSVEAIIREMVGEMPTVFEQKQTRKVNKKLSRKALKENKENLEKAIVRTARKVKVVEKVFETRKVNTGELISVKIDSKTTIYVKAGSDIEAIKAKYRNRG